MNEPNDENWIASSVCRQFTKQQKCKSLCTTNNNRPKTELCGTPQAWCATQQTTSMIWTKSRRNLKVRGATRELTNQRRAALSLTQTSGMTSACINKTHTDKHTAAFSPAWPHPAGSQAMMSSQPDLPCGEEEEVDREEKRKKGKGEKTGKELKWTCSHKLAHKDESSWRFKSSLKGLTKPSGDGCGGGGSDYVTSPHIRTHFCAAVLHFPLRWITACVTELVMNIN